MFNDDREPSAAYANVVNVYQTLVDAGYDEAAEALRQVPEIGSQSGRAARLSRKLGVT